MVQSPLNARQAAACENATHPKCSCRCGGVAHGKRRGKVRELPLDDPHHPDDETSRDRKRRERSAALARYWQARREAGEQ
jgi:hypothetical protein